jgi:hypothetical protein
MPITQSYDTRDPLPKGYPYSVTANTLTAPGATDSVLVAGGSVAVSLDGPATSVTGTIQRSVDGGANWHLATASAITAVAAGGAPIVINESGMAWYRVNVTALTGANVIVSLSVQNKK